MTTSTIIMNESFVNFTLGGYMPSFKKWYTDTVETDSDEIVAFVVRRSYMMALIMESLTGISMEENEHKRFVTDAALLNMGPDLADRYLSTSKFPSIRIVDDLLLHGRNIEHIAEDLVESVKENVRMRNPEIDTKKMVQDLRNKITIFVYARASSGIVMSPEYYQMVNQCHILDIDKMHELSAAISCVINHCDIANACYVLTERVSNFELDIIRNQIGKISNLVITDYEGNEELSWALPILDGLIIKAICTVRIKRSADGSGRVMPFIFLPQMNHEETKILEEIVVYNLIEKDRQYIREMSTVIGMRTYGEILTMILSQVVLSEFNKRMGILRSEPDETEIEKISRNIYRGEIKETKAFLMRLVTAANGMDFSRVMSEIASENWKVSFGVIHNSTKYTDATEIKTGIEDVFYSMAYLDEYHAYIKTDPKQDRRFVSQVIAYIIDYLKLNIDDFATFVSYILQMMDAGIVSISSFASKRHEVVGFAQYLKAGEMSLAILPIRCYRYLLMLKEMYALCDHSGLNYKDIVIKCFNQFVGHRSSAIDGKLLYTEEDKVAVIQLMDDLESYGQTPKDWWGYYFTKIYGSEREKIVKYRADQISIANECLAMV